MVYTTVWAVPADQLARAIDAFGSALFVVSTSVEGDEAEARLVCRIEASSTSEAKARMRILKHELLYADVDCAAVELIE